MINHPRPYKPETPERRTRGRKAKILLFVFFVGVLIAVYLNSPLSKVRTVEVRGNQQADGNQLRQASGVILDQSVWKIDKNKVRDALLNQFPILSKVDIEVSFTGRVVIAVSEKSFSAVFIQQGKFYRLLNDGTVFDTASSFDGTSLPILSSEAPLEIQIGKKINQPAIVDFCNQVVKVDRKTMNQISEIRITKDKLWRAFTIDEWELRFPPDDFAKKMKIYDDFRNRQLFGKKPGIIYIYDETEAWYDEFPKESPKTSSTESKKGE